MRTPLVLAAILLAAAAPSLSACMGGPGTLGYNVSPARVGAVYPPKPPACGIRFENLNYGEASSKYEQLGMVTLTGTGSGDFSDAMKHDVEREACKMGGDAVSMNASVPGMFQFLVWRAR